MDYPAADTESLDTLVRKLNPSASLPETWRAGTAVDARVASAAERVLRAEGDESFFEAGHLDRTYQEKNELSHVDCSRITELLAAAYPERVADAGTSAFFGAFSQSAIRTAADAIDDRGYYLWPQKLSPGTVSDLNRILHGLTFSNRLTGEAKTGADLYAGRDTVRGNWWLDDLPALAAIPELQALAFDPAILAVAQSALKAAPIHVQTNAWWTFPPPAATGSDARKSEERNAQRFHQDFEFLNFVKVFIYISDVTDETGPHVYVAGSANDYEQKLKPETASHRFTDEEIEAAFGKDRVVSITGPSGEVTFVNTRGYHKGMPARRGHRLLVQLEYASSLYFNPVAPFDRARIVPAHAPLVESVPRIFQNYRDSAHVAAWREQENARVAKARRKLGKKSWSKRLKRIFGRG